MKSHKKRSNFRYPPLLDRTGMQQRRGVVVGIAGPIAAGKSTVSVFLTGLGAREIDADAICHKYLRKPEVVNRIIKHFGTEVLDQNKHPDRWKLGRIVFENEEDVQLLNQILHPLMIEEVLFEVEEAREHGVFLVINAALLFESGINEVCDYIITVVADEKVRAHRAVTKRGWDQDEMGRREYHFMPLEEKISKSDFVIHNNGNFEDLQKQTEKVYKEILYGKNSQNPA